LAWASSTVWENSASPSLRTSDIWPIAAVGLFAVGTTVALAGAEYIRRSFDWLVPSMRLMSLFRTG
jgi:hypothetical protein